MVLFKDECVKGEISMENKELDCQILIEHIESIHTTPMGIERIKRNLSLETDDVVSWCKERIKWDTASITRQGKNWYVTVDHSIITINAYSYTIITAHKIKDRKSKEKELYRVDINGITSKGSRK